MSDEVETYFPGFLSFIDCTYNNRFQSLQIIKEKRRFSILERRKEACCKDTAYD